MKKLTTIIIITLTTSQLILKPSPPRRLTEGEKKEGEEGNQDFKFAPGFAGMPFPPMLMNGPHFHPPTNININALPFPNPRANSPYKSAIANALHSLDTYENINKKLDDNKDYFEQELHKLVMKLDTQYSNVISYIQGKD